MNNHHMNVGGYPNPHQQMDPHHQMKGLPGCLKCKGTGMKISKKTKQHKECKCCRGKH